MDMQRVKRAVKRELKARAHRGAGRRWNDGSKNGKPTPYHVILFRAIRYGIETGTLKGSALIDACHEYKTELRRMHNRKICAAGQQRKFIEARQNRLKPLEYQDTAFASDEDLQMWKRVYALVFQNHSSGVRLCYVLNGERVRQDLTPILDYDATTDIPLHITPPPQKGAVLMGTKDGLFWCLANRKHCHPQKANRVLSSLPAQRRQNKDRQIAVLQEVIARERLVRREEITHAENLHRIFPNA